MTPQEWDFIEKSMNERPCPYGQGITLECDGYEVMLRNHYAGIGKKNTIMLYVNGQIKGVWGLEDCDIRRRFFCKSEKSVWSGKRQAQLKKAGVKDVSRKIEIYMPEWTNFRSLKRHLIRHNSDIRLKDGTEAEICG